MGVGRHVDSCFSVQPYTLSPNVLVYHNENTCVSGPIMTHGAHAFSGSLVWTVFLLHVRSARGRLRGVSYQREAIGHGGNSSSSVSLQVLSDGYNAAIAHSSSSSCVCVCVCVCVCNIVCTLLHFVPQV